MSIQQFRYAADNLGYLLYKDRTAVAIDGGAVDAMVAFCRDKGLVLKYATNTHSHGDHTGGNATLTARTGAVLLDHRKLAADGYLDLDGARIDVWATPGHTADSVTFHWNGSLITGDTLFNGTVGNCFSGDLRAFLASIKKLMILPPQTRVYAGHDYVEESMRIARIIEPDNAAIAAYLAKYDPGLVRSTLADEAAVNPYVRFNTDALIDRMTRMKLPVATEMERWESVMSLE